MLARLVARERAALAPVALSHSRAWARSGAFARGGRVRQLSATTAADVTPWLQSAGVPKAAAVPLSVGSEASGTFVEAVRCGRPGADSKMFKTFLKDVSNFSKTIF